MAVCRMRITCWVPKATDIHSEYVLTYRFPTATVVAGTRLITTLHVHNLPYYVVGSYRPVNTMRLDYKNQSINAACWKSRYLF